MRAVPVDRTLQAGAEVGRGGETKALFRARHIEHPPRLTVGLGRIEHQSALEASELSDELRKIADGLGRYGLTDPETVALWAALLSVPLPAGSPPLNLTPQRQKQKTLETVLDRGV